MRHLRIHQRNADTFDAIVKTQGGLVKFYHPMCGHCKDMAPAWDALENHSALANVPLLLIDVHSEAIPYIKSNVAKNIAGFPTIVEVVPGGGRGREYTGTRTTEDLVRFILETTKRKKRTRRASGSKRRKIKHTKRSRKTHTKRKTRRSCV